MRMGFLFHLGLLSALVAVVAMAFDYLTGYLGAYKDNTVQSGKMREGLWHKGGFLGIMLLSVLVEIGTEVLKHDLADIGMESIAGQIPYVPALAAMSFIIFWIEVNSIAENLCILNPELKKLSFMKRLKEHDPAASDMTVEIEDECTIGAEGSD